MSLEAFLKAPWKESHSAYEDAVFNIRPAPEFSTAEVLVASLHRACGFQGFSENEVPKSGKEFDKTTRATRKGNEKGRISVDTWRTVVHGVLESPKQQNQSSRRFLQLCPVIPDIALYSGSARLVGNSWNPGALIQRMIQMGSPSISAAEELWGRLHDALAVAESDDVWARWLQGEFARRSKSHRTWQRTTLAGGPELPEADRKALAFPAQQFVLDLDSVIHAKQKMTRRQWISVLEAILRLGCVMHVLWLCSVNARLWESASAILAGKAQAPSLEDVRSTIANTDLRILAHGSAAVADIKQYASDYLVARLGVNALLWALPAERIPKGALDSSAGMHAFLSAIEVGKAELTDKRVLQRFSEIAEAEARTIACKKGIGSNLVEFARHCLGQRLTADDTLRGYDQGYILRKKGEAKSAPWTVFFGPVAVLALVHACLRNAAGPRSVRTLCNHLGAYGIDADLGDVSSGELGRQLRMLGLVLDSPDAESGMLLVPPF